MATLIPIAPQVFYLSFLISTVITVYINEQNMRSVNDVQWRGMLIAKRVVKLDYESKQNKYLNAV